MIILYIIILLLVLIALFLTITLLVFSKKSIYLSDKEKDFIDFTIEVYITYADDLGIQSKEEHEKLKTELLKIRDKHLKNK